VPLRSKESSEVAEQLFIYISLFGPPKELLSDQGKEFCNSVVSQLNRSCGIEHQTTTPYHPRTNGLTERFNGTLVLALSKHVGEDPARWHKWIPYVLLAYRTRVHSTTKRTPFELLFGRKCNGFEDWSGSSDSESLEIYKRSLEIRKLIENDIPATRQIISSTQDNQTSTQDARSNVQESILENGTAVLIRDMRIKKKLQPKFLGPYTITGRDKFGNYQVKNSDNKLFPIAIVSTSFVEIQTRICIRLSA
jgi:hypothetical protein